MSRTIDGSTALHVGVVEHSTRVSNGKIDSISMKSHDQNMAIKWDASGRLSDMKVMSRGLGIHPVHINFNGQTGVEVTVGDKAARPEIAKKALETALALTRHLAYVNLLANHMEGGITVAMTAAGDANKALQRALVTPMASAHANLGSLRARPDAPMQATATTAAATTANVAQTPAQKNTAPRLGA